MTIDKEKTAHLLLDKKKMKNHAWSTFMFLHVYLWKMLHVYLRILYIRSDVVMHFKWLVYAS